MGPFEPVKSFDGGYLLVEKILQWSLRKKFRAFLWFWNKYAWNIDGISLSLFIFSLPKQKGITFGNTHAHRVDSNGLKLNIRRSLNCLRLKMIVLISISHRNDLSISKER